MPELAVDLRALSRAEALALYLELRARQLRGGDGPDDPRRRLALRRVLERTGDLPRQLPWLRTPVEDER